MILLSHNLVPDTLWAKISTDIGEMIGWEPANIQTDPTKWWPKLQNPSEPEAKKSLNATNKSLTSKRLLISSTSLCNTCPASKGTKQEKILICSRPQGHRQNHYPLLQNSTCPQTIPPSVPKGATCCTVADFCSSPGASRPASQYLHAFTLGWRQDTWTVWQNFRGFTKAPSYFSQILN